MDNQFLAEQITPATVFPGARIHNSSNNFFCTAAWVGMQGDNQYITTAGHCGDIGDMFYVSTPQGNVDIGVMEQKSFASDEDLAFIKVSNPSVVSADIPIDAVVNYNSPSKQDLQENDKLCVLGARTGLSCGDFYMNSATENRLFFQGEADFGDSGAPVFMIRDGGAVYLIGVLEGYSDTSISKYLAVQSISSSFFEGFAHITY